MTEVIKIKRKMKKKDDFFDYSTTPSTDAAANPVDKECIHYLSDVNTDLIMLARYSRCRYGRMRRVFIKFNTPLPSSAPVEKLCSTAQEIEVQRRNLLSDSMFEKLLLAYLKLPTVQIVQILVLRSTFKLQTLNCNV